jgi:uncharacterized protein (TIGR00299 family) protein
VSRALHLDPFGGAAGDMLLGALLDLGVDRARLDAVLNGLALPGWRLEVAKDTQQGLSGTRVVVHVDEERRAARRLHDVETLLAAAALPEAVRRRSLLAFRRLFEAEAEVHGTAVSETHLHELAAVDAVVDIVGVCAAVELLGVSRVTSAPVPVGRGAVQTAHGLLPVPPPAVARLLSGLPIAAQSADGEMTTPTGATLLATLVERFDALPPGVLLGVGTGLGTRRFEGLPNVLRAFLLDMGEAPLASRSLTIVECTVDDLAGERVADLITGLVASGALDAWSLAGTGRKGRPVQELRALCAPEVVGAAAGFLFAEGASLGVRIVPCSRPELERSTLQVPTAYGEIPVKLGIFRGVVVSAKPEHDACVAAAVRRGVPVARVEDAAHAAAPRLGSSADIEC